MTILTTLFLAACVFYSTGAALVWLFSLWEAIRDTDEDDSGIGGDL